MTNKPDQSSPLSKFYTPEEVHSLTGISTAKVRKLCELGRLGAVNTSLGNRPRWIIPEESLRQFFTPEPKQPGQAAQPKRGKRARLDADVPKVL